MEQELANSLFPVYLSLQAIHKDKAFLQKRSVGYCFYNESQTSSFQNEFYIFVVYSLITFDHNVCTLFYPGLETS